MLISCSCSILVRNEVWLTIMFSSPKLLVKKSGKKGVDRPAYLKELIDEFKASQSKDIQEQIIANLANFSYDPLNYKWLIEFGVIDIFLQEITNSAGLLQQFSITGLSNLAPDKDASALILRKEGVSPISSLLSSSNEKCIIDAITTLIFLTTNQNKKEIISESTLNQLRKHSCSENPRIRNLALIFMTDNYPLETND